MTVSSQDLLQPHTPATVDQYVNQRTPDPLDRNNTITQSRTHLDIVTEEKENAVTYPNPGMRPNDNPEEESS